MTLRIVPAPLAFALLLCQAALAAEPAAPAASPTAAQTMANAAAIPASIQAAVPACQACHISPNPKSPAPHIAGQRSGYLAKQLVAFKAGDRKDDMMQAIAAQLSNTEIQALADYWSGQAPGSDAVVPAEVAAFKRSSMAFPADFPKGFVVFHSQNDPDSLTIGKSWANAAAMQAARSGQPLPDGSIVMVVSYKARLDAAGKPMTNAGGSWVTGDAQSYSGMESKAGWGERIPQLLRNGNWQYGVFTADRQANAAVSQASCLACHKGAAASSYVFTLKALQAGPATAGKD